MRLAPRFPDFLPKQAADPNHKGIASSLYGVCVTISLLRAPISGQFGVRPGILETSERPRNEFGRRTIPSRTSAPQRRKWRWEMVSDTNFPISLLRAPISAQFGVRPEVSKPVNGPGMNLAVAQSRPETRPPSAESGVGKWWRKNGVRHQFPRPFPGHHFSASIFRGLMFSQWVPTPACPTWIVRRAEAVRNRRSDPDGCVA